MGYRGSIGAGFMNKRRVVVPTRDAVAWWARTGRPPAPESLWTLEDDTLRPYPDKGESVQSSAIAFGI